MKDILNEMPQLVAPVDFDLNDEIKNSTFATKIFKKSKEVFEETSKYILFRTGDTINGYIVLIDKEDQLVEYIVNYKAQKFGWAKLAFVTQIALWRKRGSSFAIGLTSRMFFDYLLPNFGAIMSDKIQTMDGKNFWLDRMADANNRGYFIGFIDTQSQKIDWYDSSVKLLSWVDSKNAWGEHWKYQEYRFLISSIKP